jgi:hypothetical protein
MSGVISMCGQQQLDMFGAPLAGGLLYMLQSGTLVPQSSAPWHRSPGSAVS